MPHDRKQIQHRRIKVFVGLVLAVMLYGEFRSEEYKPVLNRSAPIVLAVDRTPANPFERLVRDNPLDALKQARDRHTRLISDYSCTMVKQELLPSGLSAEQEIRVKHRLEPFSVLMEWTRNPGLAERVLYVKGRWADTDADDADLREQALCQPGKALQVFVKSLKQPIHGVMAKKAARRSIDEFGFKRALDLLIQYCDIAAERGELDLEFRGDSHFDSRPVWVIRRHLPYAGEGGRYPDRVAEIYLDKEHFIPIAVYCFAEDDMRPESLLGKYEYRDIRFGRGFTEADFDPGTYGM